MGNVTAKTSGDIASFMTPAETNIKSLKVHFSPKQLGEGDPSPENVREIVGWDGVEVNGCGRNLFNPNSYINGYATNAKDYSVNNDEIRYDVPLNYNSLASCSFENILAKPNTKYTYVFKYINSYYQTDFDENHWLFRIYSIGNDGSKKRLSEIKGYNNDICKDWIIEFTTPSDCKYIMINRTLARRLVIGDYYIWKHGLYEGNIDSYEPYQGNNIPYQWKRLPDEYQEVEYIESTGFSWLETSIDIKKNDVVNSELIFQNTSSYNNNVWFAGDGRPKDGIQHEYGLWSQGGYLDGDKTKYEYGEDRRFSKTKACFLDRIYNSNVTLFWRVFGRYGYDMTVETNCPPCKIWYNSFTINGNKVLEFIPCYRKSDGEIGMYDTISQTFYTNQGTGEFLKGDDVFSDTVYGGYVDLISGELVETNVRDVLDAVNKEALSTQYNTSQTVFFRCDTDYTFETKRGTVTGISDFYCESLKPYGYNWGDGDSQDSKVNTITQRYSNTKAVCMRMYNSVFDINADDTVEVKKQKINTWLADNPIVISYKLATPIIHQLTPTQLSSFIGQNNFWSNADYIEIEYELKETEDIQKARKKIILNQPQLKTISNKVVSFNTDMVAPIKNCKIYFKPIQLGSGDPSPTNVRDINGWTSVDSYVNGDKISVDWTSDVGAAYGGYLDLAKNEVVATYVIFEKKWNEYSSNHAMTDVNRRSILFPYERRKIGAVRALCNIAPPAHDLQNKIHFYIAPENNYIYMFLPKDLDEETLIQVVSRIEEPIHYPLSSLTSQQLLTLKSTNHIWSETNGQHIDVTYWTRKNLTPTPLVNYLENQTWTDSAYISSSGKKTTNTVSASHFLASPILLEAGTYVLSGFSHYVGSDNTRYRIHAYDSNGKWVKQITFQQIGNLSPVDISFTLDTDTYVNVSIAMDFDGVLTKIN